MRNIIANILTTTLTLFVFYFLVPVSFLDAINSIIHPLNFGSTITTINGTDTISSSRSVINTNFSNLNTDKLQSGNTAAALTITAATLGTISTTFPVNSIITSNGSSAFIATGSPLTVGNLIATTTATSTFAGPIVASRSDNATSTLQGGCISAFATSSATQIKYIYNSSGTTTTINGNTARGVVLWAYGSCP